MLLLLIDTYKYLGVPITEHLDFSAIADVLAKSASRAMGSVIQQYRNLKGLRFNTFSRLYLALVCPILDYV